MVYHQESIIYSFHVHILFCFFPLNHWDSDLNSPCLRTNSDLLPLSWTDSISTNMTLPIRVLQHNRIIKIIYDSYCPLNDWTCRTTVKAMRSGLNKFEGDVGKCHTWLCVRDFFFFTAFIPFLWEIHVLCFARVTKQKRGFWLNECPQQCRKVTGTAYHEQVNLDLPLSLIPLVKKKVGSASSWFTGSL